MFRVHLIPATVPFSPVRLGNAVDIEAALTTCYNHAREHFGCVPVVDSIPDEDIGADVMAYVPGRLGSLQFSIDRL